MKSFFTLSICVFIFNVSLSQERINRQKINFESCSDSLLKAIGWEYNNTLGEWIDYENVISNDKAFKDEFKSLQGEYMMSHKNQNFTKILTKSLVFKSEKYYALIVEKFKGRYEYPSLKQDWYTFKSTEAYLFKKADYSKLNNIDKQVDLLTQYYVYMGSKYEKYDQSKFLDLIQTELESEKSKYSTEYIFSVIKSTDGKIRFFVPENNGYYKPKFEECYFEVEANEFSKIILKD